MKIRREIAKAQKINGDSNSTSFRGTHPLPRADGVGVMTFLPMSETAPVFIPTNKCTMTKNITCTCNCVEAHVERPKFAVEVPAAQLYVSPYSGQDKPSNKLKNCSGDSGTTTSKELKLERFAFYEDLLRQRKTKDALRLANAVKVQKVFRGFIARLKCHRLKNVYRMLRRPKPSRAQIYSELLHLAERAELEPIKGLSLTAEMSFIADSE